MSSSRGGHLEQTRQRRRDGDAEAEGAGWRKQRYDHRGDRKKRSWNDGHHEQQQQQPYKKRRPLPRNCSAHGLNWQGADAKDDSSSITSSLRDSSVCGNNNFAQNEQSRGATIPKEYNEIYKEWDIVISFLPNTPFDRWDLLHFLKNGVNKLPRNRHDTRSYYDEWPISGFQFVKMEILFLDLPNKYDIDAIKRLDGCFFQDSAIKIRSWVHPNANKSAPPPVIEHRSSSGSIERIPETVDRIQNDDESASPLSNREYSDSLSVFDASSNDRNDADGNLISDSNSETAALIEKESFPTEDRRHGLTWDVAVSIPPGVRLSQSEFLYFLRDQMNRLPGRAHSNQWPIVTYVFIKSGSILFLKMRTANDNADVYRLNKCQVPHTDRYIKIRKHVSKAVNSHAGTIQEPTLRPNAPTEKSPLPEVCDENIEPAATRSNLLSYQNNDEDWDVYICGLPNCNFDGQTLLNCLKNRLKKLPERAHDPEPLSFLRHKFSETKRSLFIAARSQRDTDDIIRLDGCQFMHTNLTIRRHIPNRHPLRSSDEKGRETVQIGVSEPKEYSGPNKEWDVVVTNLSRDLDKSECINFLRNRLRDLPRGNSDLCSIAGYQFTKPKFSSRSVFLDMRTKGEVDSILRLDGCEFMSLPIVVRRYGVAGPAGRFPAAGGSSKAPCEIDISLSEDSSAKLPMSSRFEAARTTPSADHGVRRGTVYISNDTSPPMIEVSKGSAAAIPPENKPHSFSELHDASFDKTQMQIATPPGKNNNRDGGADNNEPESQNYGLTEANAKLIAELELLRREYQDDAVAHLRQRDDMIAELQNKFDSRVHDMEKEIEKLRKDKNAIAKMFESKQDCVVVANPTEGSPEQLSAKLQAAHAEAEQLRIELEQEVSNSSMELSIMSSRMRQIDEVRDELEQAKSTVSRLEEQIQKESTEKERVLEELRSEVDQANAEASAAKKATADASMKYQNEISELRGKLEADTASTRQKAADAATIADQERQIADLRAEVKQTKLSATTYEENYRKSSEQHKIDKDTLEIKLAASQKQIATARVVHMNMQRKYETAEADAIQAKEESAELRKQLAEVRNQLAHSIQMQQQNTSSITASQSAFSTLQSQLHDSENRCRQATESLASLNIEIEAERRETLRLQGLLEAEQQARSDAHQLLSVLGKQLASESDDEG